MDIRLDSLTFLGDSLQRPECVLATASGDLFVSDHRGVAMIGRDGATRIIAAQDAPPGFMPNGMAVLPDRTFLVANLGPTGGVWRLSQSGALTPYLLEVDGVPLPPTNFVGIDGRGRTWITVSTRLLPRTLAAKPGWGDGFVIVADASGARIVADGIGYTNEAILDASGEWLYVNETYGRCLSRFRVRADSSLGPKEVVCAFGPAVFPDGLAHDAEGFVWIVSVVSNRVIRVNPATGTAETILEDADPAELAAMEQAYQAGTITADKRSDIGAGRLLANVASIAFGGPDLRTVYLGSLAGTRIASFRSPVAGLRPPHWEF
ncbi:MAG: SMP-30/gluconolactonase/LRE family protein [Acetobacteraceae bacterium]